jgi:dipeptidyl aminopeptidase/acylaminoacyl peptidase
MRNRLSLCVLIIGYVFGGCQRSSDINYLPLASASFFGENVNIQLKCGDILAGTLTYPKDTNKKFPTIILITGSSAHDRDNSSSDKPISAYRPFRQIADKLSSNGIAVLRLDDRGIGASKGGDINKMTTDERANDIWECVKYLKTRREIDSTRIGLIGLSEGASIAHMIAAKDSSIKVIVLLSGIGSKGKEIIDYQVKNKLIDRDKLPELLRLDKNLKFLFDFDPLITTSVIKQPVLIINGTLDKNVPPNDGYKILESIKSNGNMDVTIEVLVNYNHLLLNDDKNNICQDKGCKNKIPEDLLNLILDWINKRI